MKIPFTIKNAKYYTTEIKGAITVDAGTDPTSKTNWATQTGLNQVKQRRKKTLQVWWEERGGWLGKELGKGRNVFKLHGMNSQRMKKHCLKQRS